MLGMPVALWARLAILEIGRQRSALGGAMQPLTASQPPDWRPLVDAYLAPFQRHGIQRRSVDCVEEWAGNLSQYQVAGSWRAKVINGSVYVKTVHMYAHWRERGSVLMLILASLRQGGAPIPDSEFVYASADNDPSPKEIYWRRRCGSSRAVDAGPAPLFTNARRGGAHDGRGLPLPEFTFAGRSSQTPPWCQLSEELRAAARRAPFASRSSRAFFSGGMQTSAARRRIHSLAERHADDFTIRNVGFRSTGSTDSAHHPSRKLNRTNALLPALPLLSPTAACSYKFLLSLPGFGYASRLRQLLACGSVVLHQAHEAEEFFAPLLKHGEHIIRIPVGDGQAKASLRESVLMDTLHRLRANETLAARVASAAGAFATRWLSHAAVLAYTRTLLTEYGKLYQTKVELEPGYSRVESGEDVQSITKLCDCSPRPGVTPSENAAAETRTRRCLRQPGAGILTTDIGALRTCPHEKGPFDLNPLRKRRCCPIDPSKKVYKARGGSPFGGVAGCWQPRCCEGWDCPTRRWDCPVER